MKKALPKTAKKTSFSTVTTDPQSLKLSTLHDLANQYKALGYDPGLSMKYDGKFFSGLSTLTSGLTPSGWMPAPVVSSTTFTPTGPDHSQDFYKGFCQYFGL